MRVHVESAGVLAPGLSGWAEARRAALGEAPIVPAPLVAPVPQCLPPAERRRCSATARLAIAAAEQALAGSAYPAAEMAMVFAAAEAAGEITHQLCEVLAGTREVSPTVFHNSVHNAPLGYLSIAAGARRSGTSLCRGEWTFAAGLLHAALESLSGDAPVLFVCYDSPLPAPLRDAMSLIEPTALAFVLTPRPSERTLAVYDLALRARDGGAAWPEWIPAAWRANPSARGLAAIGATAGRPARLPYSPELDLEVQAHG